MSSMTAVQIKEELENISAVISNLKRRGKATEVMEDRHKRFLILLKKTQNKKQIGRFVKGLEYIKLTEAIIEDLKTKGKSTAVLEARFKELHKELEIRKNKYALQKRRWAKNHKGSIYAYHKEWVAKNKTYYNDYMVGYRARRKALKDTTPSTSEK